MNSRAGLVDSEQLRRRLQRWRAGVSAERRAGRPLIVAATGTGLAAAAAVRGGADLLAVYNSSRFRAAGFGSLASMMPYANANEVVSELAAPVIAAAGDVPVIAGVCATDPMTAVAEMVEHVRSQGFAGVQNFPTVSLIEGGLRDDLEASGFGFEREVELIRLARQRGLLACAFVADEAAAREMALAGADMVAVHVGVTRADSGSDALQRIERCAAVVQALRDDVLIACHGGPFVEPSDLHSLFDRVPALDGYVAASMVEREPSRRAITEALAALKATPITSRPQPVGRLRLPDANALFAAPAPPPEVELTVDNLGDYLREQGVAQSEHMVVTELGGGVSNVLLRYDGADRCGVVKQARRRIRVEAEWLCDIRRVLNERDAIALVHDVLPPGSVPTLQFSDDRNYIFAMDCAPPQARLWKLDLMKGLVDLGIVRRCGELLSRLHETTRGDAELRRRFDNEPLLAELRIDPWYLHAAMAHPDCADAIRYGADRLRTVKDVLVHGDFVPKNMLVTGADVLLLDWEIVHFGNPGYDVAQFICHLLLKAHRPGVDPQRYLSAARTFWDTYRRPLTVQRTAAIEDEVALQLGCLLLARVDGKSTVEYLDEGARQRIRALGRRILRTRPAQLDDVLSMITGSRPAQVEVSI